MPRQSRLVPVSALFVLIASITLGQDQATEDRDRAVMGRFLTVVEKAPRRGTALDRVYGYHVERGSLDAFLKSYQTRTTADPKDGAAWMIIGLVESQRGRDAAAVAAFRTAEKVRLDDPMPCYYLGQSLVLVGRPDDAAEAFERAIARKPNRADLLEIFQALGRIYQRAHRNEQALAVWSRLEKIFPDDPRVQEQIAASLAEESLPDQALPRYEALAKATKDKFRQVQFQVDAAELKVRLNRTADALADFEGLLGRLDPESWLHREVRRKIEEIYTKGDDLAGLANYYEGWIKKNPEDVEAMARLGKALASQGRLAEARKSYETAVQLAPTRRDLRAALIEQLAYDKKYAEAAAQYEAIAKTDPNNPDVVREWGRMLLRDEAKPVADRRKAAAAVWRRLTGARPDDPSTMVAVADLFRSAEMIDEAIELYKTAAAKSPNSPQYAEYLGEFYHRLKRPAEALATWSRMAQPPNRNPKTLGRLAEVYSGFGYKDEALAAATEAATLDRDDFDLQLRLADLLHAAEKLDDEARQLALAAKAATSEEQREGVLDREIKNAQLAGKLSARVEDLRKQVLTNHAASSDQWRVLARYVEADQKPAEALNDARLAMEADAKSIPALAMVARLEEATGNLSGAADTLRKLAEVDRRARSEYLTGVARLEARLGRKDAALKAGRDLLAAAPGQLDNHQFFAELCFQLGQVDEGLDALRRAVRMNEADPKALLGLAETLATQFRTEEAIEMFWRGFDKSPDLEAKLSVISRLTALYLQRNQFDRLIARLERQGREADRQREMTMCLAQAYSASGDYGTARAELERLLAANPRDTKLLHQLAVLSESEGDPATAAKFQKQLVDIAPGDEANARLAQFYIQAGEIGEAEALWTRLTADGQPESHRVLTALDTLIGSGKKEAVLGITENLLRRRPGDWEALYREGQALAGLGRPQDAATRFRAILKLKRSDDEVGAVAKARKRAAAMTGGDPNAPVAGSTNYYAPSKSFPLQDRIGRVYNIQAATGMSGRYSSGSAWSPDDLGMARMASLGWLLSLATKSGTQDTFLAEIRQAAEKSLSDPRPHWNLYYLQLLRVEYADLFEAAKGLARVASTDPTAQFAFLNALPIRGQSGQSVVINTTPGMADGTLPLSGPDLDLVLGSYRTLKALKPDWAHAAILTSVGEELKRAGRTDDLDTFYRAAVASSNDAESAASVLRLAAERGDVDAMIELLDRYDRLLGAKPGSSTSNLYVYYGGYYTYSSTPADSYARGMMLRHDAKSPGDVNRLLDHYLIAARGPDRIRRRARAIAMTSSASSSSNATRFQVWTGKTVKFSTVAFPSANPYFDNQGIQVLRNAYELAKRDDLVSDLTGHLKKSLEGGSDVDHAYTRLALCYVQWWDDNKDEALVELTEAAKAAKADPELLLALAELRAQRNEPEEALKVADSFEPLDQKSMQRREVLAIRLAVVTGDVARARKAAERLFGLRLDSDTQVQLASQMHQLGMHELAEAVLGRARRRAGGNVAALVALMLQYQRQGKPDQAVQVANQVLRRNPARANPGYYDEGAEARSEALRVLAASGKLKESIGRLEEQVGRTPGSLQLHQRLADYYKAAGEKDKAKLEYEAMVKLRPDDAKLRFQIASDLYQAGEAAAAADAYAAALRKEPTLLSSGFYYVLQAFQEAGKFDDLLKIVEEVDIRSLGSVYYVAQIIQAVLKDKTKRDRGLALFAKAWKAFPTQRENLFAYVTSEEIWQLSEMYDYLRESVIPAEGRKSVPPWMGLTETLRHLGNGRVSTTSGRLLDLSERRGRLEGMTTEIERAEQRLPTWKAGPALRGMALARRGHLDEARALLTPLADPKATDVVPTPARQTIGQDWEAIPALRPLALALYEGAAKDPEAYQTQFFSSPCIRLVEMYREAGRIDDARKELLTFARDGGFPSYNPSYDAYWRIENQSDVAGRLIAIGFPADGARLLDQVLADTDAIALAKDWGGGDSQLTQLRDGFEAAMEGLDPENLAATLRAQLAGQGPIDLLLLIQPRDLDDASITSLLHAAIRSVGRSPGGLDATRAALTKRLEAQPGEIPARVALVLATIEAGPPEAIAPAVEALTKVVENSPVERLEPGARANARQRQEAGRRLGLWIVARAVQGKSGLESAAKILADAAIEAADRQPDPAWTLAMLGESAREALDRGDRAAAERDWSRMLGSILARPRTTTADPAKPAGVPVATLDRFERATRLARLAARRGMVDFSLRAAAEPLKGGPPVVPLTIRSSNGGMIVRNPADKANEQAIDRAVEARISELESAWADNKAPAAEVYRTLRAMVLPEGRPTEVFTYPRPLGEGTSDHPASVAALLVRWAIRAGQVDDLRRAAETRAKQATAEAAARSILVQLDLATRDFGATAKGLQSLAALLAKDKLQSTAEAACLAALPAVATAETEAAARPVLDAAAANFTAAGAEAASIKVQLALARRDFAAGRVAEGRTRVRSVLEALDRATASGQSTARYYGGGFQTRRENLQVVAAEDARSGQWDDALETLGLAADAATTPARGNLPGAVALVPIARSLLNLPPVERYEKLRAWTMPNEARATVRDLAAYAPVDLPPEPFGRSTPINQGSGLVSTLELLIDAAKQAGRLDALAAETRQAVEKKREGAETLLTLVEIARGRAAEVEPTFRALLAEWSRKVDDVQPTIFGQQPPKPSPWADVLRLRAGLTDPTLAGLARELARTPRAQRFDREIVARVRLDVVDSLVRPDGPLDPGLVRWDPVGNQTAATYRQGNSPGRWIATAGHIHHVPGGSPVANASYATVPIVPRPETLAFQVPLAGRFAFRVDATGEGAEVGYGGKMMAISPASTGRRLIDVRLAAQSGPTGSIRPIGAAESISRIAQVAPSGESNRLAIEVEPGSVRFLCNGHLVYEDRDPSPASPWLVLGASGDGEVDFRNLELSGDLMIPREVPLTLADRLEGWLTDTYEETRPRVDLGRHSGLAVLGAPTKSSATDKDWSARDSEILGRRLPDPGGDGPVQSRLAYHRPLRSGESIAYEFFHEAGASTVHPALGRLAFLIEPGGVKLHWMADGPDLDTSGLAANNAVDDPSSRRGPTPLPLKPGEWNALKLTLVGRSVEIELNGVKVLERDLDPSSDRVFSFHRDKGKVGSRIRRVVLTGDWPGSLAGDDLAHRRDQGSPEMRRARTLAIGEGAFAIDAGSILEAAKSLPADRRHQTLLAWVLPGDDHSGFRLAGAFAATDPAMPSPGLAIPTGSARVEVGGTFGAPALALVAAAREANRLDDLIASVSHFQPTTDLDRRGRLALLAVASRDDAARVALEGLKPLLASVSPDAPEADRWPELVALAGALGRPGLKDSATALANVLVGDQIRKDHKGIGESWKLHAWQIAAALARPGTTIPTVAADLGLVNWSRVTQSTSRSRSTGAPLPLWLLEGGTLTHLPGHGRDSVYFRTPLRGDFEVTGESLAGRPLRIAYGGIAAGVSDDGKDVVVSRIGAPPKRISLDPRWKPADGPSKVRISVKGRTFTAYLEDRKLFETGLPSQPDPWLAVDQPAEDHGSLRNLKLEGEPTVPDQLELSDQPDLLGWLTDDVVSPSASTEVDAPWRKRGDEILGRRLKDADGARLGSLLTYHRPMVENGEIAYEFFHEPGQATVAPALDRLAFWLEPDGVKLERIGESPAVEAAPIPPARLPLKAGAWNRLSLAVVGDRLKLTLNDAIILERPIEPTNQRTFGLFHHADDGEARVRNVTYRGEWPKRKPDSLRFE